MQTVLLLFGGESSEHEVSLVSARNVAAAIDPAKYSVLYGYIDREGKWWRAESVDVPVGGALPLVPLLGEGTFLSGDVRLRPDIIFPVLHGQNGEDGTVQGLAELLHIPIVGCGIAASAVGMHKVLAKALAVQAGVPVVPSLVHDRGTEVPAYALLIERLGAPIFVKPVRSGSSVGVHKVESQQQLETALEDAHRYDDQVLIEKAIDARELEVAVLGNHRLIEASPVGEVIPEGEFYSYESKYSAASTSQVVIPADISDEQRLMLQEYARTVFSAIDGSGLARVDFFIDTQDGAVYFNEINTLPGFTNISVYPKAWEAAGVSYSQLVDRLLSLAVEN